MRHKLSILMILAAAASLIVSVSAFAEQYAVVHSIKGGGFVQGSQDGQTQSLGINVPIMEGDNVWTDAGGQMELLLPEGNHLWLDYNTRIEFDQFPSDDQSENRPVRARLWKGTVLIDMRIWMPPMADYIIATPSASVSPSASGLFLVEVESVDRTRVTCLGGSCAVVSAGVAVNLNDKQMTYADYGYPPLNPVFAEKISSTLLAFRDQNLPKQTSGVSQRYLPSSLYAYSEDLDSNGSWNYTADYGYVWRPTYVATDWAPYTYGQWAWEPWGATWCPYDSWGWAPFHYGRWCFSVGFGWGWCPQPYFSPAWVSWYWDDAGWIGWCPLGYYDTPLWGPCGWWSCPAGNFYNPPPPQGYNNHHGNPPPQPLVPNAQGTPAVLRGGSPRAGGTAAARLNLPPNRIRDLQEGRVTGRELRSQLTEPISVRSRGNYPAVQPSSRGSRTDLRASENQGLRSSTARTLQPLDSSTTSRGTTTPRQPGTATVPRNSLRESPGTTQPRQPSDSVTTRQPVQPRAPVDSRVEQPGANTGDAATSSGQPRAYTNINPSGTIQPRASEQPRANTGDATTRSGQPRANTNENPTGTIQPRPAVPPRTNSNDVNSGSPQPRSYSNRNPSGTIQPRPALPSSSSGRTTPYNGPLTQPRSYSAPSNQAYNGASSQVPSRQPSGMSTPNRGYNGSSSSPSYSRPSTSQSYSRPSAPQSYSRPSAPQGYSRPSAPSQGYSRSAPSSAPSYHGSSSAPRSSAPSVSHSSPAPRSSGGGGGGGKHR